MAIIQAVQWLVLLATIAIMITVGASTTAATMLFAYLKDRKKFTATVDRTNDPPPEPLPDLKHEFISVNGIRLHAVSSWKNTGQRQLMLMLHGFPEFWYSWRHQIAAFQDRYDVVAVDMRGYNMSDKPKGVSEYSVLKVASDVREVVGALGRKSCILMGHDWGGVIAWTVATLYPEAVEKLVILAAPHPASFLHAVFQPLQLLRTLYAFTFQVPYLPEIVMSNTDFITLHLVLRGQRMGVKRKDAVTRADVDKYKAALSQPGALTATINYYRAGLRDALFNKHPHIKRLIALDGSPKVTAPVLVIWADQDMALGPEMRYGIKEIAPRLQLHVLTNCSHWIMYDQPTVVNTLVTTFLTEDAGTVPK